jgi:hypothetical protein
VGINHSGFDVFGQNSGDTLVFGRTDRDEGGFIQLDLEDIAVQKEDGADGLVLGRGRDGLLVDNVSDEVIDLHHAHVEGMPLMMIRDVLTHPGNVSLFCTQICKDSVGS